MKKNRTSLGWTKPGLEAKESPTSFDIVWAAGLYEGEGTAYLAHNNGGTSVAVTQKDTWVLEKLVRLFGGSIRDKGKHCCYKWAIHGARARGFLMTIYKFLSPRRKEQAMAALEIV